MDERRADVGRGARERLLAAASTLLDLLDPTVLAPGAACLIGLLFPWLYEGRVTPPHDVARLAAYGGVAWVMGFVCVIVGRQVRLLVSRRLRPRGALHDRVTRAVAAHGLPARLSGEPAPPVSDDPLARYESAPRLLERLEATLRASPASAAQRDLERLASRAAACDGLAVALLVGAAILAYTPTQVSRWPVGASASMIVAGLVVALALVLWAEASRLEKERLDALVATVAAQRQATADVAS